MPVDLGKLKEKFERKTGRADRLELKDGENEIRILPPSLEYLTETVDYISFEYLMHYGLGSDGNKQAEACPKSSGRQNKCPICEAVAKLYKLNTPEDKQLASQLRAKKRHLFNAIDMHELDKGIQVLEVGPMIYEDLVVFVTNPKWGDLLDLDKGRTITITKVNAKESSTGYVEYSVTPDPDTTSVREKLPKNYKEALGQLKKALPTSKTYDELKAILEGEESPIDVNKVKSNSDTPEPADETEVEEKAGHIEPVPPKKPVTAEAPKCFGKDYGPRRTECIQCSMKSECRERFLEV